MKIFRQRRVIYKYRIGRLLHFVDIETVLGAEAVSNAVSSNYCYHNITFANYILTLRILLFL